MEIPTSFLEEGATVLSARRCGLKSAFAITDLAISCHCLKEVRLESSS